MNNHRGRPPRSRGGDMRSSYHKNKNNDGVQSLVDYLPQNVIRRRRTPTQKKNLGIGQKRTFDDIIELDSDFFKDVEEADELPENFEIPGPIPDLVDLYTYTPDVTHHGFYRRRRSNNDGARIRTTSTKENEVISSPKERETSSNSKMGITVSDQLSLGSAHVPNTGTVTGTTSGGQIQHNENGTYGQESSSNSNPKPWILKYKIPGPIPDNLDEIMRDQSLLVNFWADIDDCSSCSDSDNE